MDWNSDIYINLTSVIKYIYIATVCGNVGGWRGAEKQRQVRWNWQRQTSEANRQPRMTMVTQKDMTDTRRYCLLSPPPPHSEAASDGRQPHSTLGSTQFALHRSDHVTSSFLTDTAHLERHRESYQWWRKRKGKARAFVCSHHSGVEWRVIEVGRKEWTIRSFV